MNRYTIAIGSLYLAVLGGVKIKKILVIDDDVELCSLLGDYFRSEDFGFACAHSGNEGLRQLTESECDIIVLDVMLPGRNGFEILKEIRNVSSVPVVMLTAKGDHIDRVVGLEIGADDYICKPFNMRELSARVKAVLRRSGGLTDSASYDVRRLADLEMDISARFVKVGGRDVYLTAVEFDLLELLLSNAGKKISLDELSVKALGRRYSAFDRSLSVHISKLRHKLGAYSCGSERIRTLRNVGFMYVYPERALEEAPPA